MIDIETVGTGPNACILTIAAQTFDPFSVGYHKQDYYARVDVDSQPDREVDDATVEWWATQPQQAQDEAFSEEGRIPLHPTHTFEKQWELIVWARHHAARRITQRRLSVDATRHVG